MTGVGGSVGEARRVWRAGRSSGLVVKAETVTGPKDAYLREGGVATVVSNALSVSCARRRRRLSFVIAALVALVGVVVVGAAPVAKGTVLAAARIPGGPVVDTSAFSGHGLLAFVSRGRLWVIDGATGSLTRLPAPSGSLVPQGPVFSSDGRWLAYLEADPSGTAASQLWIARGDGAGAHHAAGLPAPLRLIGWSPTRDLLAVAAGPQREKQPCPCYTATTVRLVSPAGSARTLATAPWVYGAAWSPDGDEIAIARIALQTSELISYPVSDGRPVVWLSLPARERFDGMTGSIFDLAGWWPDLGIGFWVFGDGMVHNNDAAPLDLVRAPRATPRLLGQILSDGTTDTVAAGSRGQVAVVTDHGGGRIAWLDKQLDICTTPPTPCRPVISNPSLVTVDPAWSPGGQTLAFAEAPNITVGPWTQQRIAAWFAAHQIELIDLATDAIRRLEAATGAADPVWSTDGKRLLYVRDDGIWLLPSLSSPPVEIASPLFPVNNWPQYYAQVAWSSQFAWWSP